MKAFIIYVLASVGFVALSTSSLYEGDVVAIPPVVVTAIDTTTTTLPPTTTTTLPPTTTTTLPTTTTTTHPPTTTTTLPPVRVTGNIGDKRIRAAVLKAAKEANALGYDVCPNIRVNLLPTGENYALATASECLIEVSQYSDDSKKSVESWMAHEVAHLITKDETVAHGPEWLTVCRDLASLKDEYCFVPTALDSAEMFVGTDKEELGFSDFWCAEFVEAVLFQTGRTVYNPLASPSRLMLELDSVSDPKPGDIVGISYFGNDQVDHVAVIVQVTSDGVKVIEGNGSNETKDRVGYNFWPFENVARYGR